MSQKIADALSKLDVNNDNHWTEEGLPRVDTVRFLASDQSIERGDIQAVAPELTREQLYTQRVQDAGTGNGTPAPTIAAPSAAQGGTLGDSGGAGSEEQDEPTENDELAALDAEIAQGQAWLTESKQEIREAQEQVRKGEAKLDELIQQRDKLRPPETAQDAIRGYLNRQTEEAHKRGQRRAEMLKSGVDLKGLRELMETRAPIDRAMARKNSRGMSRPGSQ